MSSRLMQRKRAAAFCKMMDDAGLNATELERLSGYHRVTIRRFRSGDRPLARTTLRYLTLLIQQYRDRAKRQAAVN